MVSTLDNMSLNLFTEEYHIQYLHDVYRPNRRLLAVAFNDQVDSTFSISPIVDTTFAADWCVFESQLPTDSVVLWITDSVLYNRDTLRMQVSYTMKDSAGADYLQTDTLEFLSKPKAQAKADKKKGGLLAKLKKDEPVEKKEEKKLSELKIEHNLNSPFNLVKPIRLKTNYPIKDFDATGITLTKIDESEESAVKFTMSRTEGSMRSFDIDFERDETAQYRLLVPAGTLTDVYGNINDTLKQDFKTQMRDYYSTVVLNIDNVPCNNAIVQLLDTKEKVLEEYTIGADTTLTINYLEPGSYLCKMICDDNRNGKWDTGNFNLRRQPERVFYFNQKIETKSSWDIEYTWKVE